MARVSINISVLEGGRIVWAVADIGFPFKAGPLLFGSRSIDHVNTRIQSIRSAMQQNFYQAKALIPSFKPVSSSGTIAPNA
jgi:hypothetical protein